MDGLSKFCVCRCFHRKNIFLKDIRMHIDYVDRTHFLKTYRKTLLENGFDDDMKTEKLINEIEDEVTRRKRLGLDSLERKRTIEKSYTPLHREVFTLKESHLSPKFLDLVKYCRQEDASFENVFEHIQETNSACGPLTALVIVNHPSISVQTVSRAYVLPVFTDEFCRAFLEEILHFDDSSLPKGRPNTMNKYGVLLDELGFDPFFTNLRQQYMNPITRLLYPDIGGGELDSHKVFIVKYKQGEDTDLDYHYDNAEVTLNVALSSKESYTGGNLYFGAMKNENDRSGHRKEFQHQPTMGLLHRGQHLHGASEITSGERYNLILWMRASSVRNKKCPMCDIIPDLLETVGFGDGFTKPETVDVCSVI